MRANLATQIATGKLLLRAPAARLPPPVFTGAAPLPLGSLPAGLPTQLIRLRQNARQN